MENPQVDTQETKSALTGNDSFDKNKVAVVVIALLLVGALGYWFHTTREVPEVTVISPFDDVGGTIYLSLRESSESEERVTSTFAFDMGPRELRALNSTGNFNAHLNFSPSLDEAVYVGSRAGESAQNITQLYLVDVATRESRLLTQSDTFLKRFPEWSPDGEKIAFMAQSTYEWDPNEALPPEAYSVYVADRNGENEVELVSGAFPKWTPTGDIVFLKIDGIYVYRTKTGEEEKVWNLVGGVANVAMSLNVSPDGNYIVWSTPFIKRVKIMKVNSWEPFKGSVVSTIDNVRAYWPVISEDSQFVTFQSVKGDDVTDELSPHGLVIYSLETLVTETLFDLKGYDLTYTAITDWRTVSR